MLNLQKKLSNFLVANCPLPGSLAAKQRHVTSGSLVRSIYAKMFCYCFLDPQDIERMELGNTGGHGGSV